MAKKKIAMVFPYAPSYREPIYKLMDEDFDCTFYFCSDADYGLKYMDYSHLKNVNTEMTETKKGPFMLYSGISKIDFSGYDVVMHPGTIRNLSSWYLNWKVLRMKNRPKLAIWTHGWYGKESKLERIIKRYYYSLIDKIYVYGDYAKKGLIKEGVEPSHLITIYNSLDYDSQKAVRDTIQTSDIYKKHFGNDNPVIIMIGRLNIRKKLDMLIEAVSNLNQKDEHYNIVLIGDGEDRQKLESLVREKGVGERVWFYGACFDERTNAELLFNSDLCVIPGDIGLTAIHAMTLGVPVISHNCFKYQGPEFEAIVPGVTGDFFEHDSMESLCSTLSNWFKKNSSRRNEVRKACYDEVYKHWTPQVQLDILKKTL